MVSLLIPFALSGCSNQTEADCERLRDMQSRDIPAEDVRHVGDYDWAGMRDECPGVVSRFETEMSNYETQGSSGTPAEQAPGSSLQQDWEQNFLADVRQEPAFANQSASTLISRGYQVCELLSDGFSTMDIVVELTLQGQDSEAVARLVSAAHDHLC